MKNKFQRLSKEEKIEAINEYKSTNEVYANIFKKVKRLKVICIIGMVYAVISFAVDFYLLVQVWDFVIDAILLIFCLLFYLGSSSVLGNQVNNYLIEKSKQQTKGKGSHGSK